MKSLIPFKSNTSPKFALSAHLIRSLKSRNLVRAALTFSMLFFGLSAEAQFVNIPVTGYNADVVANGVGSVASSTTATVDNAQYTLAAADWNFNGTCTALTNFMPISGTVSANTSVANGLVYTLQSYSANNALRIPATGGGTTGSGTFTLASPTSAANLYLLYTAGNGPTTVNVTVTFTDASTQIFTGLTLLDWFTNTNPAIGNIGRLDRTSTPACATTSTGGPYLFDLPLALSSTNYTKQVQSITIDKTNAAGTVSFFAVGSQAPCAIPVQGTAPNLTPISTSQINGSFTASVSSPTGYLIVRYPAGATPSHPVNGISYTVNQSIGAGGIVVQNSASTTFNATGLASNTAYDFYMYPYNSGVTCGGPMYNTSGSFMGSQITNSCVSSISGVIAIGPGLPNTPAGGYTSITNALTDINANGLNGATTLELQTGYTSAYATTNETFPISFSSNACITTAKSLTIRPASGVSTAIALTSSAAVATIIMNGATNITFDGRPGGSGTSSMLTIQNSNVASAAIQFINDANNNTVRYCTVQSVENTATNGTIVFAGGIISGNSNNLIDNCTISDGATNPVNGIYSAGSSATVANTANTISNCNISNYFSATLATSGILLSATGNHAWIISGNRFYQTSTRVYTTANTHNGISILSGSGYTISNNIIGYANNAGTGTTNMIGNSVTLAGFPTAYTTTGTANATRFVGINASFTAGGTVSNIQNNTIAGMALFTSSGANTANGAWCGINIISGNVNIGSVTGNTIGATSGAGSVYVATTVTGGTAVGIYTTSANTVTIQNNSIGAIDAMGTTATLSGGVTGIDIAGVGNFTIANNNIGNASVDNIRTGYSATGTSLSNTGTLASTTGATAALLGIRSAATGSSLSITNNLLRGWVASGTASTVTGITSSGTMTGTNPSAVINNNNLGNSTTGWMKYMFANSGALIGISLTNTVATTHSVSSNDITGIQYMVAGSNANTYITLTGATAANNLATISNNTFTNLNVNTTGSVTFINHSYSVAATGTQTINGNQIVTAFNKGGIGNTVTCMTSSSSSATGAICNHTNNNFSNITVTGATAITGITNTDGASSGATRTVTGNTFRNWTGGSSAISLMSYSYLGGTSSISSNTIYNITGQNTISGLTINSSGSFANPLNISNNSIGLLTSSGTGGNVTGLTCSNTSPIVNIFNNTIDSLSSSGASSTVLGLAVTGATLTNVYSDTVYALYGSGTTSPIIQGILISGGTNVNVYKNKVYNLFESGAISTTSPAVSGLLISAGTNVTAYNNLIGDLRTPAASLTDAIRGINITSSSASANYNIYYNTVYLNASSTGANFGATGLYHAANATATTAKLDLRDNIITNNSTASGTGLVVAFRRSAGTAGTLSNYASTSNNNLFFAGTPGASNLIYADGTSTAQTIAAYRNGVFTAGTLAPRDVNSVSENPSFLSTLGSSANFLHINPAVPTQIESGGSPIAGITTDYDGNIRNANKPDIGANEFNGIVGGDVTPPTITYLPLNNSIVQPTLAVSNIVITDPSGVNSASGTKPRFYYKKVGDANAWVDNTNATNGWKYVEASNTSSPFTFTVDYSLLNGGTGVIVTDTIQYFITAQDSATIPNVGINAGLFAALPTSVALTTGAFPISGTINRYVIFPNISGTKTICATGCDFTSLTNTGGAFNVVNNSMVTSNVTLQIAGDLTAETGTVALNEFNAPYTLTILPTGAARTISGSSTSALIKLNGADRVTIDGSLSGGTDQSLIINNTNTASPSGIWLSSLGVGAGAIKNTIKNCKITVAANASTAGYGICLSGSTLGSAGADNDSNTIQNNTITNPVIGIYANGTASVSTGGLDNVNIIGDTINIANTSSVTTYAIQVGNSLGCLVSQNTMSVASAVSGQPVGISIETGYVSSSVTRNNITAVTTSSTGGYAGRGITIGTGTATSNLTVANNFISGINGSNYSSFSNSSSMGIGVGVLGSSITTTAGGINLWYNSVNMYGDYTYTSACSTAAVYVGSATSALDVRNNIFVNSMNNTSNAGSRNYSIYSAATNTVFSQIDYNDYFVSGSQGVLGYIGSERTDMAGMKNGFGSNNNSLSADPQFTSSSNLHIPNGTISRLESAGTVIPSVTIDIDGQTRPGPAGSVNGGGTAPDIGADEFDGTPLVPNDMKATAFVAPTNGGSVATSASFSPQATFTNSGINAQANIPVRYRIINSSNLVVYNQTMSISTLASGASTTITFPSTSIAIAGNYTIKASAELSGDQMISNDTITGSLVVMAPLCGTYNVGISQAAPFNNLTNATTALSNLGISCPVTFVLTDNSYSVGETFPLTINAPGSSSTNTVLIKPATGVNPVISGSVASGALLKIIGSYITLDGSNSGGTSRNMSFVNSNTSSPTGIWISSTGAGTIKNTIKNCNISTASNASGSMGIAIAGSTLALAGADNDSVTIQNDSISKAYYGIIANGTAVTTAGGLDGLTIINNIVGPATSGSDNIGASGIWVGNSLGVTINNNVVRNVNAAGSTTGGLTINSGVNGGTVSQNVITNVNSTASTSGTNSVHGIYLGNNVINLMVANNRIDSVISSTTSGYGARALIVNTANAANLNIINNMIENVWCYVDVSAVYWPIGIDIDGSSGGINLYNNSVNLFASKTGYSTGATASAALYVNTSGTALDIRNNVFSNSYDNTSSTSDKSYALYSTAAASNFSNIDYNQYWVSGSAGVLAYFGGSDQVNMSALRTVTTMNKSSDSGAVAFLAPWNLHIDGTDPNAWNTFGRGIALVGLSTDIDGDPRSTTVGIPTTMGADQIAVPSSIPADAVMTPAIPVAGTPTIFTSAGRKIAEINWTGSAPTSISAKYYPGVPPPGATNTPNINSYFDIPATPATGYNYTIKMYYTDAEKNAIADSLLSTIKRDGTNPWNFVGGMGTNSSDANGKYIVANNLTGFSQFSITGTQCPTLISGVTTPLIPTLCGSGNDSVTASGYSTGGGVTYQWQSSSDSFVSNIVDLSGVTIVPTISTGNLSTTTYYRLKTICAISGTSVYSTVAKITVNSLIANDSISASQTICSGNTPAALTGSTPTGGNGSFTYQWQSSTTSATGGFSNISGASNTGYTPGSLTSTTYYRRYVMSGGCTDTATALTITVNPTIANNTVSASQTICSGNTPAALTGSTPTGGNGSFTYQWQSSTTSATGGFSNISGASNTGYTPGALTSTTYYRRYVMSGGCTDTATSIKITVNTGASISTNPPATYSICATNTILLSVVATNGLSYQWYKGVNPLSNGGNISGATSANLQIANTALSDAGTYNVVVTSAAGCNNATSTNSVVSINSLGNVLASTGSSNTYIQADGITNTFTDASCDPIVKIQDAAGGNVLGSVTASVTVTGSVQTAPNGQKYLQRYFIVTPTNNGSATVTLYALQSEFTAYNAAPGTFPQMPILGSNSDPNIANIRVTKYSGSPFVGGGNAVLITPTSVVWNATSNWWEITFPVTSFSSFYIHTGVVGPLEITLRNINAVNVGNRNRVDWNTSSETDADHFEVERSVDGTNFSYLTSIKAKGQPSSYSYWDEKPYEGVNYYRLKIVSQSGRFEYSATVNANVRSGMFAVQAFPNPVSDQLTIKVEGSIGNNAHVIVTDMTGKLISRTEVKEKLTLIDMSLMAQGVYFVKYHDDEHNATIKVNKQ
ncbi:MAG: T9SS type A sorting domain-containing protein [Bacteroidetes bacterium]|nr:T9SS type A sorting domain-containing protein [Bacteroidota bacterium]